MEGGWEEKLAGHPVELWMEEKEIGTSGATSLWVPPASTYFFPDPGSHAHAVEG